MNYLKEAYPHSMKELVQKSEKKLIELVDKLNDKECKRLNEFYEEKNNKVQTLRNVFREMDYIPNSISGKSNVKNELKGLYLFGEASKNNVTPIYVGISRTMFRRLKQHGWGKTHYQATHAYAKEANSINYKDTRINNTLDLSKQQKLIRQYKVAIIPEVLDFDLSFMEIYCAGKLKTKWNTFRTH